MAITKICQGQPYLSVRLSAPGCQGGQLIDYEKIRLVITAPQRTTCEMPLSRLHFTGCWPGHDTEKYERQFDPPDQRPIICYDAFKCSPDGDIVFRLDAMLYKVLPPGRYVGLIEFKNGTPIVKLDIDLCFDQFVLDRVTVGGYECQ